MSDKRRGAPEWGGYPKDLRNWKALFEKNHEWLILNRYLKIFTKVNPTVVPSLGSNVAFTGLQVPSLLFWSQHEMEYFNFLLVFFSRGCWCACQTATKRGAGRTDFPGSACRVD